MSQRILVIESEPWLAERYRHDLESAGFDVKWAANGYSAIDSVDDDQPHVIVMGIMLDGPSAIGLMHELQSYVDTADIPIVVCTNLSDIDQQILEPYGVSRVINTMSMKPDDITAAVRSVLA